MITITIRGIWRSSGGPPSSASVATHAFSSTTSTNLPNISSMPIRLFFGPISERRSWVTDN